MAEYTINKIVIDEETGKILSMPILSHYPSIVSKYKAAIKDLIRENKNLKAELKEKHRIIEKMATS